MSLLEQTIHDPEWLRAHTPQIKALFPDTFTHVSNANVAAIAFQLKLLGVDWRSQDELAECFATFEKAGIIARDGQCFKAKL